MPMQPLQKGEADLQVLEALKIVFMNRWSIHTVMMPAPRELCKRASPLTEDVKS